MTDRANRDGARDVHRSSTTVLLVGVYSGLTKAEIGGLRCGSPKISEAKSLFA
jgi:hypothetical protein